MGTLLGLCSVFNAGRGLAPGHSSSRTLVGGCLVFRKQLFVFRISGSMGEEGSIVLAWGYNLDLPTCVTSMKSLRLWKTKSGAPARWTIATARLVGLNEASTSSSNPVNTAQISVTDCGSFAWELTRSNLARAASCGTASDNTEEPTAPSGGNHRGSIFRLLVGKSLIERDGVSCPSWELGKSKPT